MRKKFTMLLAALFLVMGTAWAYQFSYDKTTWTVPATSHEKVSEVPTDVFTVYNANYSGQAALDANKVGVYAEEVNVAGGTVTVHLQYVSGNGSNIRLDICGVDLVAADGTVKYKDYHFGYTGGNSNANTYTLSGVEAGSYTLRVFVPSQKEDFTATNNNSRGTMTITGTESSIVGSTAENKIFYHIKNVRSGKYANYEGANVQFTQVATPAIGSYWYLMEVADAEGVPEGYKAYRLYNAGNTLAVENPSNGNMSANEGVTWPAKIYCIGEHTKDNLTGVVIRPLKEDGSSWNDAGGNGTKIGTWSYDDAGSIWEFERADITESRLIQNAVAIKTGALNNIATEVTNTQRYFYGYELSDLEAKNAEIEAIAVPENSLADAVTGAITISKMSLFAGLDRIAPKAGDKFTMVNRERNGGKDGLVAFAAGTDVKCLQAPFAYFDALWTLVAADDEGQFKLYNEKMNVYVGVLSDANNTAFKYVAAEDDAGVYELANVDGYATFKKVGGDAYSHLHQSGWGGKEIVRWDNGSSSQWQLVKAFGPEMTTDAENPILYALRSGRGNYHFTLDNNKVKLFQNKAVATDETTQWYFMLDESGNLKMYSKSDNKAMGYITVADGNTKLTNAETAENYAGDTYTLYFAPYNLTNRNSAWFALKPTSGNTYVSNHGGTGNYMGFYNSYDDDGTRIAFESVDGLKLEAKIAECEAKAIKDAIGYYSVSGGDAAAVLAAAKAALQGNSNAAYRNSLAALEALIYTVNLPEAGKYYRIGYDFGGDAGVKYVQDKKAGVQGNAVVMTSDEGPSSIYYVEQYGEKLRLKSCSTDYYVKEDGGTRGLQNGVANGGDVTFSASPNLGQIKIQAPSYFHAHVTDNGVYYVEHCSGTGNPEHTTHYFIMEEVDITSVIDELAEQFQELVSTAQGLANALDLGRYTSTLYDDAKVLGAVIEDLRNVDENTTIAQYKAKIDSLEVIIASFNIVKPGVGFYYFVNYDNDSDLGEYLSDDRKSTSETQRVLTNADNITAKNVFYYDGESLIGYASGFGFEYGICNTNNPAGRNHFTFEDAYDNGRFFVKSTAGTSTGGWVDSYWKNNSGELGRVGDVFSASSWDIVSVAALPVTIGDLLHSTFFAPVAVAIPDGVKAYTGVVNGEWLTLTEVERVIPAETAVVLIAEKAKTYEFAIVESEATAFESHLRGTTPTKVNDRKDANHYYTLQSHETKGVAFKKYTGANLGGFKAYLEVPAGSSATALRIRFAGEDATGIESVGLGEELVIYDLAGRRVQKMEKGIYIVNGKKVVIK